MLKESEEFDPEILQELQNATLEEVDESVQNKLSAILDTNTQELETPEPEMKIENIQYKVWEQCQLIRDFSYNFADPDVAKSFLNELTELYMRYYAKLASSDGVLELSKEQHWFKTIRSHTQKKLKKGVQNKKIGPLVLGAFGS